MVTTATRQATSEGQDAAAVEARIAVFIVLFLLDGLCRALLVALVPQQVYHLLGSAFAVSVVYFGVAFLGLFASLGVPVVLHVLARRHLLTVGCLGVITSVGLMSLAKPWAIVAGLMVQMVSTAAIEILLNLYLLEQIPRRALSRFEPRRLLYIGTGFIIGPWLGVFLHHSVLQNLTFGLVALSSTLLLACFWRFRMTDGTPPDRRQPVPRPLRSIPRFFRQPRLVLAWVLAIGRNGWWTVYFVYTPILVAAAGYGPEIGGAAVSAGMLPLLLVRQWGRLGERYGMRRLLMAGYAIAGLGTLAAGLSMGWPGLAIGLLCTGALGAGFIDGAGNVPFLRAVHPHERAAMTSVFMTFRHVASITFPGMFAVVLAVAPLAGVYVTSGLVTLAMAALSRYIPRRM
ncbi:MAG: hypothetical protein R3D27_06050 [Hyphomicrobiaceae bacterium]